jgi:hypothetical protein
MPLRTVAEGFVSRRQAGTPTAIAAGPRCVALQSGEIVCSFVVQSALGVNDFATMLARSGDGGISWDEARPVWPGRGGRESIFCSISRAPSGDLYLSGMRWAIEVAGESFWSDATQGMKPNDLVWSRSRDHAVSWSEPRAIPLDGQGSVESPGALCITRAGRWLVCYAPYNTLDPAVPVDRGRVVVALSDDDGRTWRHRDMLRFAEPESGAAEAWVIELADGRLLGAAWHIDLTGKQDYPNAFAVSSDGGDTWLATASTGIVGQSNALAVLPDGRALFVYNQRKYGEPGVYLAAARPSAGAFGVEWNQSVWRAARATVGDTSPDHADWTGFAFGEPSIATLTDGSWLVVFWCVQPDGQGVRFVKLREDGS